MGSAARHNRSIEQEIAENEGLLRRSGAELEKLRAQRERSEQTIARARRRLGRGARNGKRSA